MPWLVKDENGEKNMLFVHVPRCGGTSLTKLFKVPKKAREGQNCYHKIGMTYFFYRYKLLETRNFPFATIENAIVAIQVALGVLIWYFGLTSSVDPNCNSDPIACMPGVTSFVMWSTATITFTCSTFLFTAPISGRLDFMRRAYTFFVGIVLSNFTSAYHMLTGVGDLGYIVHWTAEKIVRYGHLSVDDFDKVDNFSIVRNPYSRMVSIYEYNRFGPLERFDHFVEVWYQKWKVYKEAGSTDENVVYCHVLPEFEYTHRNGSQLVRCVIKQEDLRGIVNGSKNVCLSHSVKSEIPPRILKALRDMPHSNRRQRSKPWQDYFSARTMKLVLEMYKEDFEIFDYPKEIPGRPDLDYIARGGQSVEIISEQPQRSDSMDLDGNLSEPNSSKGSIDLESPAAESVLTLV